MAASELHGKTVQVEDEGDMLCSGTESHFMQKVWTSKCAEPIREDENAGKFPKMDQSLNKM